MVSCYLSMKLLYLTAFPYSQYQIYAKRFLSSFLHHQVEGHLLLCQWGFDFEVPNSHHVYTHRLDSDPFLVGLLQDNQEEEETSHQWENANITECLSKIAALHYAVTTHQQEFDMIIWVDVRTQFTGHLKMDFVGETFGTEGAFYHLGEYRIQHKQGIDTTLIGFRKQHQGYQLLEKILSCYQDKTFQKMAHWHDSWIFRVVLHKYQQQFPSQDLAQLAEEGDTDIVASGVFGKYLRQNPSY